MDAEQAALHFAASLLEQALASVSVERGRGVVPQRWTLETFEKAPPNVRAALANGLDADKVTEAMAKLAEELRGEASITDHMSDEALRAGISGFVTGIAMHHGAALGREMAKARDARPCPQCGAEVGKWCKADDGRATVHRERREQRCTEEQERDWLVAVETLVAADLSYLKAHPDAPSLVDAKVRLEAYAGGIDSYSDIGEILKRGTADADEVVAWRVAELRKQGIAATAVLAWSTGLGGGKIYSAYVRWPDGKTESPVAEVRRKQVS